MPISNFFTAVPNSGTGTTPPSSASTGTGNIFLDVLNTAANWDILRRTGLPGAIDGGRIQPVSDIESQNASRTPPAAPGGSTGFRFEDVTGTHLAIGGAGIAALVGLYLLLR